jgi:iron complex outermembrane receptor protein
MSKSALVAFAAVVAGSSAVTTVSLAQAQAPVELPPVTVIQTPSPVHPSQAVPPKVDRRRILRHQRERTAQQAPAPANAAAAAPLPQGLAIPAAPVFAAVTVAGDQEINRAGGQSIGQILQDKPGITSTGFAPGSDRPVIRGLSGFRVTTLENGTSTGDVGALSDDHGIPVDPLSSGRIEVVRGPATLRYGSQAIGGVVNVINSRVPDSIPVNGVRIEMLGGFTSVNRGFDGGFLTEAGSGNFVLHADGFGRKTQDYDIPGGTQLNSSIESYGGALGGSFVGRDGFVGVAYSTYNSKYDVPGGEQEASRNFIDLEQKKLQSVGEWRVNANGIDTIRTWFAHTTYQHAETDRVPELSIGSLYNQEQYEGRVEIQHQTVNTGWAEMRGALGAQYTNRDLSGISDPNGIPVPLLPPSSTQNAAGYIFEEFKVSRPLTFQAAARVENSDVKGTASIFPSDFLPASGGVTESPSHKIYTPVSYSGGLLYEMPQGIIARFTAQHAERAPDATELFYRGPHDSTATFEIGDPNLKIEQGDSFEIGLKRAAGQLRFDTSAYYTQFTNFIYKRFTGNVCPDTFDTCVPYDPTLSEAAKQIVYSQRNARFIGAEILAEYDVAPVWRGTWGVQGQYDFVHATFDDGSFVPKIPPHRLGGGVYYYDKQILTRLTWLHAFNQNEFGAFDTATNGYDLVNAEVSYTTQLEKVGLLSQQFTVGLRAENLLNDNIRNAVSYKKDQVEEPGRSVRLFGSIKLN